MGHRPPPEPPAPAARPWPWPRPADPRSRRLPVPGHVPGHGPPPRRLTARAAPRCDRPCTNPPCQRAGRGRTDPLCDRLCPDQHQHRPRPRWAMGSVPAAGPCPAALSPGPAPARADRPAPAHRRADEAHKGGSQWLCRSPVRLALHPDRQRLGHSHRAARRRRSAAPRATPAPQGPPATISAVVCPYLQPRNELSTDAAPPVGAQALCIYALAAVLLFPDCWARSLLVLAWHLRAAIVTGSRGLIACGPPQ